MPCCGCFEVACPLGMPPQALCLRDPINAVPLILTSPMHHIVQQCQNPCCPFVATASCSVLTDSHTTCCCCFQIANHNFATCWCNCCRCACLVCSIEQPLGLKSCMLQMQAWLRSCLSGHPWLKPSTGIVTKLNEPTRAIEKPVKQDKSLILPVVVRVLPACADDDMPNLTVLLGNVALHCISKRSFASLCVCEISHC